MKAAVFTHKDSIEHTEVETPRLHSGEALVRVTGCGVCGTDVHILHGQITEGIEPPVVLGHEITGVLEQVASDVPGLAVGQKVAVDPVVTCGQCHYCHSGCPNLCSDQNIIGYKRNGGFAQYCAVPGTHVVRLADNASAAQGILVETLACVLNGFDRLGPQPGGSALVIGAGTVGLLWTQLLAGLNLTTLAVSEPVAMRRELAGDLGAEVLLDPSQGDLADQMADQDLEGFDYVIDASGDPAAVEQGIGWVSPAGRFLIFGVCPRDARITVSPFELYNKQIHVIASKMPALNLSRAARIIEAGRIDTDAIVTQTWSLERLDEAMRGFHDARDKQVKVMIDPWA